MNGHLDLDLFEIAPCADPIPVPNRLSDGLIAAGLLNSIVPNLPPDDCPVFGKLVVLIHSHKGSAGYAIRRLQYYRTGSAFPEKLLHMIRQTMKEVLWAS